VILKVAFCILKVVGEANESRMGFAHPEMMERYTLSLLSEISSNYLASM
jgi:hypothetical protein